MGLILLGKSFKGGTSLPPQPCQAFPDVRQGLEAPGREGLASPTTLWEVQGRGCTFPPVGKQLGRGLGGERLPQLVPGGLTPEGSNQEKGLSGCSPPSQEQFNSSQGGGPVQCCSPRGVRVGLSLVEKMEHGGQS